MKMTKILSLVLVLVMALACFSFVGCEKDETIEIKLWVSTTAGVDALFMEQVEAFKAAHPEYNFNITIETVGEGDAATEVLKDVATAPDMYCFAQDQISRLVVGGALAPLGTQAAATVKAENDIGSVGAATVGGNIYAYPFTSDNGYYLYYDSSVVSDEDAKTLEGIIEACRKAGKKFGYNLTNAWIMAGFFFAQPVGGGDALCHSNWTYSEDGKSAIGIDDNFNSDNGLVAMKAMHALANSGVWVDSADNFAGTGAIVTGIWNANAAEGEYGDNMKATKLPTFTVDGETYQMGSFSGYKLLGCKPQTDEKKAEICNALALWLTSEEAQLERYYEFQWGPSNKAAQGNQDVQGNALLAALLEQNVYAVPQGVIHADWWTEAAALGTLCAEADKTDADLRAALATYEEKVNGMIVK
jgi:arabinogalactan oligomer/maltooligosaccharide transport system substrate-binding protein